MLPVDVLIFCLGGCGNSGELCDAICSGEIDRYLLFCTNPAHYFFNHIQTCLESLYSSVQ